MPQKIHHVHRKPTAAESYICLILVGVLIFTSMLLGAPIQFGILLACAAAFLMALRLGFTWEEMELAICERIGRLSSTMLIMWLIGMLLGAMLYSGLLPMLVYYGFELIDPRYLYLGAFLACTIMSTMTGSSWSAAGTAGVVCMALAHGHGVDMGIMGGAVVAGSVFGDKISPMSETTTWPPPVPGRTCGAISAPSCGPPSPPGSWGPLCSWCWAWIWGPGRGSCRRPP